jgi:hypothetical protein
MYVLILLILVFSFVFSIRPDAMYICMNSDMQKARKQATSRGYFIFDNLIFEIRLHLYRKCMTSTLVTTHSVSPCNGMPWDQYAGIYARK